MKIAIPMAEGKLCRHFGHCEQFLLTEVNTETREVLGSSFLTPPPHEPGLLPRWLAEQGATCIIAGGMGGRAQQIFEGLNIKVITGVEADDSDKIVKDFLDNVLVTGANSCDH